MDKFEYKRNINFQTGAITIFAVALYFMMRYSYNLFHSILELFIIVTAIIIFIISYNSKKYIDDSFLMILGTSFFYISIIRLLHILSYKGMGVFIGFDANLPTQLWISSRYLESLFLLFALIYSKKSKTSYRLMHFLYFGIVTLLLCSIFLFKSFPDCYIEGIGLTKFKNISEYIIILLFILSIIKLRNIKEKLDSRLYKFIIVYIAMSILCGFMFTLYSDVYGIYNFMGHYFNLIAFIFLYKVYAERGLKNPYETIFSTLKLREEELIKDNDIIAMKNIQLEQILNDFKKLQSQLIQSERLFAIGQLAAGVAHEINNPLGFVISNTESLQNYVNRYKEVLKAYSELKMFLKELPESDELKKKLYDIETLEKNRKIQFISEDLEDLFKDTNEGLSRINKIVKALRSFSRIDQTNEMSDYDINYGIKTTLNLAKNEIKYYAKVETSLEEVPMILANGGQVNQVLLNILINAVQAIKAKNSDEQGVIKISTWVSEEYINCSIEDNGIGIKEENLDKIFEVFFTTKKAGEGTGLGLSISYDIIVNKHKGKLVAKGKEGIGAEFTLSLPI